mgnify:CR=1 FL=1
MDNFDEYYSSAEGMYKDRINVIESLQNDYDNGLCPMKNMVESEDITEEFENNYENIEGFTPKPKKKKQPKKKKSTSPKPLPIAIRGDTRGNRRDDDDDDYKRDRRRRYRNRYHNDYYPPWWAWDSWFGYRAPIYTEPVVLTTSDDSISLDSTLQTPEPRQKQLNIEQEEPIYNDMINPMFIGMSFMITILLIIIIFFMMRK